MKNSDHDKREETMTHPYLKRARIEGNPLIDGNRATFIWHGESAPLLIGDFNGWEGGSPAALGPVAQDLWAFSTEFPGDAYIEYVFWNGSERLVDPFNHNRTPNGFGKHNHFFYMPQAKAMDLAHRKEGVPEGEVFSVDIEPGWYLSSARRKVHFYRPLVAEPCPLVVVWDGQDYLRRAHLPVIIDNLIFQKRMRPVALAMVENGGRGRGTEYLCSEGTIKFLLDRLLPEAYEMLNLIDIGAAPGEFGVLGASAGGLMALYSGLRLPHIFGKVLAQSGAYTLDNYDFVVWDLARTIAPEALKIWLAAGCYEMLVDCNRCMAELLEERGFDFRYDEYAGGHNYRAWRKEVAAGLEFLFG
jgi:enterochelin esterase family protein